MAMLRFADVEELIAYLRDERKKGDRFVTRFILIGGRLGWDVLLPRLANEVEEVICLSEFCSGPDVCPDMYRIEQAIQSLGEKGKSVLIIPLAECIRLDSEYGYLLRWLAQVESSMLCRIYVPLVAGEEFLYQQMRLLSRGEQGLLPETWFFESEGESEIIVAPFVSGAGQRRVVKGIREYLAMWEKGSLDKVWLITELAASLPVHESQRECRVKLYPSSFEFVCEKVDWKALREEWGSADEWGWLAGNIEAGEAFDQLAARLLKVRDFDADMLFPLWGTTFDHRQKWLAWLWSKKCSIPGSYLHHALEISNMFRDFSKSLVMTMFELEPSKEVVAERKKLLKNLGVRDKPPEFWEQYSKLQDPLQKLAVLTDYSAREKEEVVLVVGELLRRQSGREWWDYLEIVFPHLARYLSFVATGDEFADQYFTFYNACRVMDGVNDGIEGLIRRWVEQQLLWTYPTRSEILSKVAAGAISVVWVDGLGLEWAGLLQYFLTQDPNIRCEIRVARSQLPTTTEANKQWEQDHSVDRQLDSIAHHYEYHFPASFVKLMEAIEHIARRVLEVVTRDSAVVVTSDHGLSRFAATSEVTVDAPAGAVVEHWGRYAKVGEARGMARGDKSWVVDRDYVVLLNHHRFKGGSRHNGEIHGGAAPEEVLVPIIVVRRDETGGVPRSLTLTLPKSVVRTDPRGRGLLTVICKPKLQSMDVYVLGQRFAGQSQDGYEWVFHIEGLRPERYSGKVYSRNRLIGEIEFEIVRGIERDDLGLL